MFKSIVVGTDGSDTAIQAVRQAVELAHAVGAKLELVSAYEPVPAQRLSEERREAPEDLQWAISPREDVDAKLEAAASIAREAGVAVDVYPRQGDPADAILDIAEEREADLIVEGNPVGWVDRQGRRGWDTRGLDGGGVVRPVALGPR